MKTKAEIKEYLVEVAGYLYEEVEEMNTYRLFDAWLQFEGICGYTDEIIEAYRALYCEEGVEEDMEEYVLTRSRCIKDSDAFRRALSVIKSADRKLYRDLIKTEFNQMAR